MDAVEAEAGNSLVTNDNDAIPGSVVWTAYVRDANGNIKPAGFSTPEAIFLIVCRTADHLFKSCQNLVPGPDYIARQLYLDELAQVAVEMNATLLCWSEGDLEVVLPLKLLTLMERGGLIPDDQGVAILYEGAALALTNQDCSKPPLTGGVQVWLRSHAVPTLHQSSTAPEKLWIYDDRLDWTDEALPPLPMAALPLSSLCENGKALFSRVNASTPIINEAPVVSSPVSNSLVPSELLANFNRLHQQVDTRLIPPLDQIRLEITEEPPSNKGDPLRQVKIRFPAEYGQLGAMAGRSFQLSELQRDPELPADIGSHPMPGILRSRLVRHLSWTLFHHSSYLEILDASTLLLMPAFLPQSPANSDEVFRQDSADTRYPCLARAMIADREVAVLVLGQQRSNLVCQPIVPLEIPAAEVPSLIPRYQDLVHPKGQVAIFNNHRSVLLPASMVDFPSDWYSDSRLHWVHMIKLFREAFLFEQEQEHQPGTDYTMSLPGTLTVIALVLVVVLLIIL